jgi:hypothetical protein
MLWTRRGGQPALNPALSPGQTQIPDLAPLPTAPPARRTDLSATELRDVLLALDPLNKDWVVKVNRAEAEFWRRWAGGLRSCACWTRAGPPGRLPQPVHHPCLASPPARSRPAPTQKWRCACGHARRDLGL